jgi:hypothetical protein
MGSVIVFCPPVDGIENSALLDVDGSRFPLYEPRYTRFRKGLRPRVIRRHVNEILHHQAVFCSRQIRVD